MYSTCLFCHSDLGTNEVIESFPIGRRLAFDAARGRLWVVCRKCERWNLTPLEERWEAVEQCERLFTSTRLRVSSDNIGLSRLREGLELVRIGKPLRPEMAAWRYGDQFGRRRRKYMIVTGAVGIATAGVLIAGPATGIVAGGGYGMFQLINAIQRAARDRIVRARIAVPGRDLPAVLRNKDMKRIVLSSDGGAWTLRVPYNSRRSGPEGAPKEVIFVGADALRAAAGVLPAINIKGANREQVSDAVRFLERTPDPNELFLTAARVPTPKRGRKYSSGSMVLEEGTWTFPSARDRVLPRTGPGETFLDRLPQTLRLALEMAAHEDIERRAMEGELSLLERAWREAEEIAAISDSMFLPAGVEEKFESIKKGRR
jgi:hypothetical protein